MKTDALNRRIRFEAPSPLVRRVLPTEADFILFEAINRHGPLPSHYLYEFTKHLRKDKSHLQNRLTEFYNGDAGGAYLTRPPQQFASFHARYSHVVYDLTPRAKALLAERGSVNVAVPRRTDPFLHQLMQACVGASLELGAGSLGLRYIPRAEILSHPRVGAAKEASNPMALPILGMAENSALIPDDLFGLEYPGTGFRFFAVEIDRNTESIERKNLTYNTIGKKVDGYMQVLTGKRYKDWWGIPNLTVLTVTTSIGHAANIMSYIGKQGDPKFTERFAIKAEPLFGANWRVPPSLLTQLLGTPWQTPGGTKDIARP
jgi:Replication-relaxation